MLATDTPLHRLYWRRAGDIRAFSHAEDLTHRPAQDAFMARFGRSKGAVGI